MTPKQKKEHIKLLKSHLSDFKLDAYDWYKYGDYRIKFKKVNVRIERSLNPGYMAVKSMPIVKMTESNFVSYVAFIKRVTEIFTM